MRTRRRATPRSVAYIALRSVNAPRPWWDELLEVMGSALMAILVCAMFILALPTLATLVSPR